MIKDRVSTLFTEPTTTVVLGIIKCESNFNTSAINYNKNKTIDVGVSQINSTHFPEMKKMNLDPYDWHDDLTYMKYLIDKNGYADYSASRTCWH